MTMGNVFRDIQARIKEPMPNWSWCNDCHLPVRDIIGVVEMVEDRIGERIGEVRWCSCNSKAAALVSGLYSLSNLPHRDGEKPKFLENFISRDGAEVALEASHAFIDGGPPLLTLMGATGTGKSHLAEAICREYISRGQSARFEYVSSFLDSLRGADGTTVQEILQRCLTPKLLVLDDLGIERGTEWTAEKLTSVVEQRITRNAKTLITTNLTGDMLREKGYDRLASRMFALATQDATVAVLTCTDARGSL